MLVILVAATLSALGANFSASGLTDHQRWTWFPGDKGQAQWQFFDLSWEGSHFLIELVVQTRGWQAPPPSSLPVVLHFYTFSSALTRHVPLQKVGEAGPGVTYFGQILLARRELQIGSYLAVKLRSSLRDVEIGVHPSSMVVKGERSFVRATPGVDGAGGPFVPSPSKPPAAETTIPSTRTFRECAGKDDAPFVSPDRYLGELGWPGPGHPLDAHDWLQVNLKAGELLEVRVSSPKFVVLRIVDPFGREIGHVEGLGQLGLLCQGITTGAYGICISVRESAALFTYSIDIAIRR